MCSSDSRRRRLAAAPLQIFVNAICPEYLIRIACGFVCSHYLPDREKKWFWLHFSDFQENSGHFSKKKKISC